MPRGAITATITSGATFHPLSELGAAYEDDPTTSETAGRFNWHSLRHPAFLPGWSWDDAGPPLARHASLQMTWIARHLLPSEDHNKAMDQIAKGLLA